MCDVGAVVRSKLMGAMMKDSNVGQRVPSYVPVSKASSDILTSGQSGKAFGANTVAEQQAWRSANGLEGKGIASIALKYRDQRFKDWSDHLDKMQAPAAPAAPATPATPKPVGEVLKRNSDPSVTAEVKPTTQTPPAMQETQDAVAPGKGGVKRQARQRRQLLTGELGSGTGKQLLGG